MGIRSKAAHFVSDLTTVFLNPISDNPSAPDSPISPDKQTNHESGSTELPSDEDSEASREGPDTSSFTAFLYSLLSSESGSKSDLEEKNHDFEGIAEQSEVPVLRDSGRKKSLFSRGKQSLGKAVHIAARLGGFRNQSLPKGSPDAIIENGRSPETGVEETAPDSHFSETVPTEELPGTSEPSLLLSEKTRSFLYTSLPVLVQGRKWLLLYSTWRHGISLSTLYRRSMLWPGLSLLVVGDRKGAVFGGLVEAPLRPTNKRRYQQGILQGNNDSFVFTNLSGDPAIFRPTGVNRYFTLCSTEYIALGGGGHFALYLDGDLLLGSSSSSETYGNPCLANSQNFEVKEVELWGFVYASKYEEMVSLLRTETPGICRW